MTEQPNYHAHVYFDAETVDTARQICEYCRDEFGVAMGRMHERAVGPHPDWSCQLTVSHDQFADVMNWLTQNRQGLVIFTHPNTGNDLLDHRDHPIWMGAVRPLKLELFEK